MSTIDKKEITNLIWIQEMNSFEEKILFQNIKKLLYPIYKIEEPNLLISNYSS
jgi:hypothetical protein